MNITQFECRVHLHVEIPVEVALSVFTLGVGGSYHGHRLCSVSEGQCAYRAGGFPSSDRGLAHCYGGLAQGNGGPAPGDGGFAPGDGVLCLQEGSASLNERGLA